jgi:hypothetical protein
VRCSAVNKWLLPWENPASTKQGRLPQLHSGTFFLFVRFLTELGHLSLYCSFRNNLSGLRLPVIFPRLPWPLPSSNASPGQTESPQVTQKTPQGNTSQNQPFFSRCEGILLFTSKLPSKLFLPSEGTPSKLRLCLAIYKNSSQATVLLRHYYYHRQTSDNTHLTHTQLTTNSR